MHLSPDKKYKVIQDYKELFGTPEKIVLEMCWWFFQKWVWIFIIFTSEWTYWNRRSKLKKKQYYVYVGQLKKNFAKTKKAKKQKANNFKISIDGHGADECLGGYSKDLQLFPMFYQNSIIGIYQSLSNIEGMEYTNKIIN